jgi:hypothetical protein
MTQPILPITPREAKAKMVTNVPSYVIEVINTMLAEEISPRGKACVTLYMKDIADRVRAKQHIEGYLDSECWNFESIFEKSGWNVTCDRPGYNESYDTNWTFTEKRDD